MTHTMSQDLAIEEENILFSAIENGTGRFFLERRAPRRREAANFLEALCARFEGKVRWVNPSSDKVFTAARDRSQKSFPTACKARQVGVIAGRDAQTFSLPVAAKPAAPSRARADEVSAAEYIGAVEGVASEGA